MPLNLTSGEQTTAPRATLTSRGQVKISTDGHVEGMKRTSWGNATTATNKHRQKYVPLWRPLAAINGYVFFLFCLHVLCFCVV